MKVVSGIAMLFIAPTLLLAATSATQVDKVFIGKVSQGGMYEVEAGKLAMQRATMPDVRDQAATDVHDHEIVNDNLKKIAAATGVPVAGQLNAEFQARLDKLKSASTADFDRAYITDSQQIHNGDEKLFAKEAMEGSAAYKTFAHQTDLIVKRHLGGLNAPGTL